MRNLIKSTTLAAIFSMLIVSGCKKDNQLDANSAPKSQKEVVLFGGAQAARQQDAATMPRIKVNIPANLAAQLSESQNLTLVKTAAGEYEAQAVTASSPGGTEGVGVNPDPSNPCNMPYIIAQFNAFMAANRPAFLAIANATCQPFWGGWSDPVPCVCFLFVVYPNSPRCPDAQTYMIDNTNNAM